MIAFGGITWSLIYCFKFYKSKNVIISFRLVKKLQQKYIEYIIYNNTNHNIVISDIFLWQKRNILGEEKIMTMQIKPEITFIFHNKETPKEKQIFIPANQEYKPQISISKLNDDMSFHNNQKIKYLSLVQDFLYLLVKKNYFSEPNLDLTLKFNFYFLCNYVQISCTLCT